MATRRRAAEPEAAAEAGFPVEVRVPVDDGPLVFTYGDGTRHEYTVEGGRTTASTRARLDELVRFGGTPLVTTTPADGGDNAADQGGDDS